MNFPIILQPISIYENCLTKWKQIWNRLHVLNKYIGLFQRNRWENQRDTKSGKGIFSRENPHCEKWLGKIVLLYCCILKR